MMIRPVESGVMSTRLRVTVVGKIILIDVTFSDSDFDNILLTSHAM